MKDEEGNFALRQFDLEDELSRIPDSTSYSMTDKEYELLKEDIEAFIEEAGPRQKRFFLTSFIKSIIVHSEKLVVAHFPPMLPQNKHHEIIGKNGRGLSVMELAVPTGLEPVSSA